MARVLQLSDLHVVAAGKLASGVLDTRTLLREAIDRLLERRAGLEPLDAALVTGDISDDGTEDSYKLARSELERLGLPLLVIPGNHDVREALRRSFIDVSGMPATGPIDWTADINGTLIIGLDTLVEGQGGGRLRAESLKHLADALKDAGTRPVIVGIHHPPLKTGIRFMDAIGLENTAELEAVLESAHGDVIVVAGHVHGVYQRRIGRHSVLTAPAICSAFALDRRAGAQVGFLSGPTGCAVIDTGEGGVWSAVPLEAARGPFPF